VILYGAKLPAARSSTLYMGKLADTIACYWTRVRVPQAGMFTE